MCEYCKKNMESRAIEDKYAIEIIVSESFLYLYCDCGRHVVVEINYCPQCRKEAGRVKHITLKEMLNIMVDCIINSKEEYPTFYYKRQNYYTGNDEFIEITEIDLMCGRFKTVDDDFSEFSWELEKSNIYMKEDKQ